MGRRVWQIHSWLGLVGGLILLLVGLSGSVLVFREELELWLAPEAHRVAPRPGEPVRYDEIYEAVRQRWPDAWDVRFRRLPLAPDQPVQVAFSRHSERMRDDWFQASVNPHTGEVLIVQHALGRYGFRHHPMDWLLWLHSTLLARTAGMVLVGLSSIVLLASSVTGLWIARRRIWRGLFFRVRLRDASWRRRWGELHTVVGVWFALLNLVFAATGFWMTRYIYQAETYASAPAEETPASPAPAVAYSLVFAKLAEAEPQFQPTGVSAIRTAEQDYSIFGRRRGQSAFFPDYACEARVNGKTGEIISVRYIDEKPMLARLEAMVTPIHFGTFGGLPIKILWCLGGMAPAFLALTGTAIWWRRLRAKESGPGS